MKESEAKGGAQLACQLAMGGRDRDGNTQKGRQDWVLKHRDRLQWCRTALHSNINTSYQSGSCHEHCSVGTLDPDS
jgi:hypothetical protein